MAEITKSFPPTPSAAVASYNYNDVADGTGIVVLFGVIQGTSEGDTYALTRSNAPSRGTINLSARLLDGAAYNFNLGAFNTPKTVRGTATFIAEFKKSGGNVTVTITIKHIDGVTGAITDIGGPISKLGNVDFLFFNIPIPLTLTHFKKGDILRCNVALSATDPASYVWCDPTGTSGEPLRLLMPFNLDL